MCCASLVKTVLPDSIRQVLSDNGSEFAGAAGAGVANGTALVSEMFLLRLFCLAYYYIYLSIR